MRRIIIGLAVTLVLGLCLTGPATESARAQVGVPPVVLELLRLHNLERARAGLSPLRWNSRLNNAAQSYTVFMLQRGQFGHEIDGRNGGQRIAAQGYTWLVWGENIARGFPTPAAVMQAWMNSPGHRANILCHIFTEVGFGVAGNCWVVDFGTPR